MATVTGTGNELANYVVGTAANNLLYGAAAADTLSGLEGDDVLNDALRC